MINYYTGQETQVWLEFALKFNYINYEMFEKYNEEYDFVIGKLVVMSNQPEKWSI